MSIQTNFGSFDTWQDFMTAQGNRIIELEAQIAERAKEIERLKAENERLNKMREHCENCGADYMATGIEAGCPCLLKAENDRLKAPVNERPRSVCAEQKSTGGTA